MLIDTNVIIWYMRGNPNALKAIEKYNGFTISVVTYMELVQGMRNKNELTSLRKALKSWDTKAGSPYKAMQVGGIGKNYAHNVLILLERTHENVGRKLLKLLTCIAL